MEQVEKRKADASVESIVPRPRRHQRSRKKGSSLPDGVVCVTRPGKWGNPFSSADVFRFWLSMAIQFHGKPESFAGSDPFLEAVCIIARDLRELRGKDLACWCGLDHECHADTLLEFANS